MKIYNTLTKKKEVFTPITPGKVNLYVCGITAYAFSHIGHARSAIVFDVFVRFLRYQGYKVNFIRNYTDIDDKIIARAQSEGRTSEAVADEFIQAFKEDMDALGVLPADVEPKATDNIVEMIELCKKLIEYKKAYVTATGDVYFSVRSFPSYGKLSGRSIDDLRSGTRILPNEEKEDPLDFALWKAAKPGEPFWDSPWGHGRPGWHIECSAMCGRYSDLPLDIHGGGLDLIFPHHENEIAQTESALGKELARIWMHNGFVQFESEKMSKSLGNFKSIRDILTTHCPETIRLFLLTKHYRSPIDFSFEGVLEIERSQRKMYECILDVHTALEEQKEWGDSVSDVLLLELQKIEELFMLSLEDDCNTAGAIGHVFSAMHVVRQALDDKVLRNSMSGQEVFKAFLGLLQKWNMILGLFGQSPEVFLYNLKKICIMRNNIDVLEVEALIEERQKARKEKEFVQADTIREKLRALGVEVKDIPDGKQVWDVTF